MYFDEIIFDSEVRTVARAEKKVKKEEKKEEEAKVEPIKPHEKRGGKKKSLLDTCE
jgi:hypothetical protein